MSDIPKSKINAFRIDFDSFDDPSKDYNWSGLVNQLRNLEEENSACRGGLSKNGVYDGIF